MTNRERIMAVIRGEVPDRLPWVPRLDFWYRAHAYRGTLPQYLRGLSWPELADRIDIGRRSPAVPVTPPYVRVRIRRFGGLSD